MKAGDSFALGQLFVGPYYYDDPKSGTPCATKFGVNVGVQALAALDVASQYALHGRPVEKTPSPFTADEILTFLREVFDRHGLPSVGVLLSSSVWQSSAEMLLDDEVSQRAARLPDMDIEIGPMDAREKDKVVASLRQLGLRVEFDEDRLSLE
jgi:hypothetical protein